MKNRSEEQRVRGLRLPGDPLNGQDREDIREMFARGEGLDPRRLTIFKDGESLLEAIRSRRVYYPTDGALAMEEALTKLSREMEEEALARRSEASHQIQSQTEVIEEDPKKEVKVPLWKRILKTDDASFPVKGEEPVERMESETEPETGSAQPLHSKAQPYGVDTLVPETAESEHTVTGDIPQDYSRETARASAHDSSSEDSETVSQDYARESAQDKDRFSTSEIARVYTDDRKHGQRPNIRRIEAVREEAPEEDYSGVEEGTAVFLSLAASQSDSISGTVTGPVSEPAVTMATSRLPKITDDHLQQTGRLSEASQRGSDSSEDVDQTTGTLKERGARIDHLTKSTIILIVGLILSKLTGQMRQVLYPHVFVEKQLTDAYVQGFLIPDFIYELLVGGSIQAAIVPTLASALGTKDERKTWHSVSIFISFVSLIMLVTLGLAEIFAPQLLAPFVKPENLELTSRMARVLFPQTFFMMGAALSIGIINAYSNFLKTSFGPAIYNSLFAMSLLILGTSSEQGLIHVGIGVSLSALAYFLFQIFLGRREVAPYRFGLDLRDKGFRKLLLLAVPILFSSSIAHLNTMVLHGFTKSMEAGAATALNQANSVWLLPYGVFTVAIGQAMLPTISTLIGREKEEAASSLLSASIRRMLFFAIPSAITFYLLREDLMMGIFIWRFDGYDAQIEVTRLAARLLQWYCISIIVQGFIYLYNYAFYAMKVTYLPLINGILSLALTLAVGSYITQPHILGAEGLSVSYALAGTMTALILGILFKLRFKDLAPKFFTRAWGSFFIKMIPMTLVMIASLYLMETFLAPAEIGGKIQQLIWLGLRFGVAFGLWFAGGKLLKLDLKIDPHIPKKSTP